MNVTIHPFVRPDDADAFRQALRRARQRTGMPLAFGGQVTNRVLRLSDFLGARTNALRGLNVMPETGLGGYVVAHRRPLAINDYARANTITHDYDNPVLAEGIRSITAAPVTVRGTVRGVLYAGVRSVFPLGNGATSTLLGISRQLAGEIAVRDEVDGRIQLLEGAASSPPTALDASPGREELGELYTEFRSIACQLQDAQLRGRLLRACDRFARVGVNSPHSAAVAQPSLSPRELDVLSHAALGCSNAEIAERLSLLPETVKAYLRSATRELGVHGRNQAVVAARRQGLLPLWDDRNALPAASTVPPPVVHGAGARSSRDYNQTAAAPVTIRTHAQVTRFFDGLEVVAPGVVQLHRWRPGSGDLGRAGSWPTTAGWAANRRYLPAPPGVGRPCSQSVTVRRHELGIQCRRYARRSDCGRITCSTRVWSAPLRTRAGD